MFRQSQFDDVVCLYYSKLNEISLLHVATFWEILSLFHHRKSCEAVILVLQRKSTDEMLKKSSKGNVRLNCTSVFVWRWGTPQFWWFIIIRRLISFGASPVSGTARWISLPRLYGLCCPSPLVEGKHSRGETCCHCSQGIFCYLFVIIMANILFLTHGVAPSYKLINKPPLTIIDISTISIYKHL